MRNYRDLQVWSKAHHMTLELYRESRVPKMLKSFLSSVEAQIELKAKAAGTT